MLFPLLVGLDQKTILSQRIRGFVIKCLEEVDRPPARVAAPGLRLSPWLFLSPPPPGRDALGLLPFGRKGRQGPEPPRPAPSARDGPLEARTMLSFSFVPTSLGTRSLTGGASGAGGARRAGGEAHRLVRRGLRRVPDTTQQSEWHRRPWAFTCGLLCTHLFFSLSKAPGHMY